MHIRIVPSFFPNEDDRGTKRAGALAVSSLGQCIHVVFFEFLPIPLR